jgi:hypothetical protein
MSNEFVKHGKDNGIVQQGAQNKMGLPKGWIVCF